MEQSPSWETVASSAGLEIPRILWKPNFHYRIHKSHPLVPIMKHISSAHVLPSYWLKIRFNGILPSTPRASQWSLSFRFPNQKFCFHFCLLHTYNMPLLSRLSWLDHPEWYLVRSTIRVVPYYAISPTLLFLPFVPKYLSLAHCFRTPSLYVLPLVWETMFHTHTKQQEKLRFVIF